MIVASSTKKQKRKKKLLLQTQIKKQKKKDYCLNTLVIDLFKLDPSKETSLNFNQMLSSSSYLTYTAR